MAGGLIMIPGAPWLNADLTPRITMVKFQPLGQGEKTAPVLLDWFPTVSSGLFQETLEQFPGAIVLNEMAPVFGGRSPYLVLDSQLEVVAPAGERCFSDTVWLATRSAPIHLVSLRRSVVLRRRLRPMK